MKIRNSNLTGKVVGFLFSDKNNNLNYSQTIQGFTLIELLVTISIIGLLSTLAVVSLNGARTKARDARRLSDIRSIQSAIEIYKMNQADDQAPLLPVDWADFSRELNQQLMGGAPLDPTGAPYVYCVGRGGINTQKYLVGANLEQLEGLQGGLSGAVTTYPDPTYCILSTGGNPTALPICDPRVPPAGDITGVSPGTKISFCLGYL